MAESYAIIETGGKQYRAEKGTELLVDRLSADEGDKVSLRPVMFRGDGNVVAAGAARRSASSSTRRRRATASAGVTAPS
jgi:large subunit ribosomal protein L21